MVRFFLPHIFKVWFLQTRLNCHRGRKYLTSLNRSALSLSRFLSILCVYENLCLHFQGPQAATFLITLTCMRVMLSHSVAAVNSFSSLTLKTRTKKDLDDSLQLHIAYNTLIWDLCTPSVTLWFCYLLRNITASFIFFSCCPASVLDLLRCFCDLTDVCCLTRMVMKCLSFSSYSVNEH